MISPRLQVSEDSLGQISGLARQIQTVRPPIAYTVVEVTTVAETFVDRLVAQMVESSGVGATPFGQALLEATREDMSRTWDARYGWLKRGFGLQAGGSTQGQDLRTLVDLRNALVHGGGRLTDRQSSDLSKLIPLEKRLRELLAAEIEGRRVRFVGPTDWKAVGIVRAFILWADGAVVLPT